MKVNPLNLYQNYSIDNRMLCYTQINEHFFTDTFFTTKEAGKSLQQKLAVSFLSQISNLYMTYQCNAKLMLSTHLSNLPRKIGAQRQTLWTLWVEQSKEALVQFCHEIGYTLRYIEEGTPWTNKAELYIGLIKEAVQKDMMKANSPISLWDYCVERCAL